MEGTYQLILDTTLRCTTSAAENELIRREKRSRIDGEARERMGYMSGAHLVQRLIILHESRETLCCSYVQKRRLVLLACCCEGRRVHVVDVTLGESRRTRT